jgi:hypothetical protein
MELGKLFTARHAKDLVSVWRKQKEWVGTVNILNRKTEFLETKEKQTKM